MERLIIIFTFFILLSGCAATNPPKQSDGHLTAEAEKNEADVPPPVGQAPFLPPPQAEKKQDVFTIVVNSVPVKELLFALARDANMNVDIHPGLTGEVTLNAVNQTMTQILNRISEQVPIHYVIENDNLVISPDLPFFRSYKVNYVNMSRNSSSSVKVATEIATAGGSSDSTGNTSNTAVTTTSNNAFWETLIQNVESILNEGGLALSSNDSKDSGDSKKESVSVSNNVIANPLSGILTVRATQTQHKQIQAFLDQVLANAQRQVLIEATIVEVELSDRYQAGVDWQGLAQSGNNVLSGSSNNTAGNLATPPNSLLSFVKNTTNFNLSLGVSMLETFGNVHVLSSPKIIAINNQTSLLKVVDEKVYFHVKVEIEEDQETNNITSTFNTEIHTVPVGMIMSVTPQINENGIVTMNIRPTITRITRYVRDPTPQLQRSAFDNRSPDFENLIPEIQVREMESILQVGDGQTVVLGGLMQNKENKNDNGVPFLSSLPFVGSLFKYKDNEFIKTELVIFLRPVVVHHADVNRELHQYKKYLPQTTSQRTSEMKIVKATTSSSRAKGTEK